MAGHCGGRAFLGFWVAGNLASVSAALTNWEGCGYSRKTSLIFCLWAAFHGLAFFGDPLENQGR